MTKQDILDMLEIALNDANSSINFTTYSLSDQEKKDCLNSAIEVLYTVNPDKKTYPGIRF